MDEDNEEGSSRRTKAFMEQFSLQLENYPRDLLHRFISTTNPNRSSNEEEEEEEDGVEDIELNLGLSLGGKFGVDKIGKNNNKKKLIRSSSIAMISSSRTPPAAAAAAARVADYPFLVRTSSLPAEVEEEWRKRKEFQILRRLAAKRRRSDRQRNNRGMDRSCCFDEEERKELSTNRFGGLGSPVTEAVAAPPFGLQAESQGGSSSGLSESETKPLQGSGSWVEARSPASNQSLQERSNREDVTGSSGTKINESTSRSSGDNLSNKPDHSETKGKEIGKNAIEDMPCVFTKGDGPDGKRIEGILYKYGKGQEVRIMCVCHGKFLSPAEFVEHAGGGSNDVAHPLRHIVVNPYAAASSFL